ncbi:MAG: deaminase [Candidatus Komeilibacteria bacterium]
MMTAEKWLQEAANSAKQALCHQAKCGCVIVKDDEVIGRGYNAPPLDSEANRRCDLDSCCVHAEWRAIMDTLRHHPDMILGSTLYFTRVDNTGTILKSGQPYCTVCSRLALDVGIITFVLWHEAGITEYPTAEYNRLSYENSQK